MGDSDAATEGNRARRLGDVIHRVLKETPGQSGMFATSDVLATALMERGSRGLLKSSNMSHQRKGLLSLHRGKQAVAGALQQAKSHFNDTMNSNVAY